MEAVERSIGKIRESRLKSSHYQKEVESEMKWKHFDKSEFFCKCGRKHDQQLVSDRLVCMLDLAREKAGVPFVINSGYRCPEHNKEIGGVKNSAHTKGLAADILTGGSERRYVIVKALIEVGFRRLGFGRGFVHADIDETKPFPVIFLEE